MEAGAVGLIFTFVQQIVDFFTVGAAKKLALEKAIRDREAALNAFFTNNQAVEEAYQEEFFNQYQAQLETQNETRVRTGNLVTAGIFVFVILLAVLIIYFLRKK